MSSTNFTPSNIVDMTKERDWPANLGMLDWDNTSIVFTKRSLLEFLKYAGVTVDPNFINIQKLPRYAQFGKLDGSPSSPQNPQHSTPSDSAPTAPVVSSFRPTRRVREAPGGTHTNLFSNADDDAAASAPPPIPTASAVEEVNPPSATKEVLETTTDNTITQAKGKQTSSGVASLWSASDDSEQFKPTRRVREMPGGRDSISGLF